MARLGRTVLARTIPELSVRVWNWVLVPPAVSASPRPLVSSSSQVTIWYLCGYCVTSSCVCRSVFLLAAEASFLVSMQADSLKDC